MSQQQPSFSRIGTIIRNIANYAAYALGLTIIIAIASLFSAVAGPSFFLGCICLVCSLWIIAFVRIIGLTRELMDSFQALGDDRNIMQFKLFTRFLFNSIAVDLIGFFWAVVCVLIMLTPFFFPPSEPLYDYGTGTMSTTLSTSMAGEITLCIVGIVIGLAYTPHSYKAWKLVDDYFILLHDPWARDIALLGTKKVLDGHKVAFGATFMAFGAIGYHVAASAFFIPTVAVCALVAGVKYIQGLYRVGTGFTRIPTGQVQPLYQTQQTTGATRGSSAYLQPSSTSSPPQPAYFRYQPSQVLYNRDAAVQNTPPPDPLANTTGIQRQLIQRTQAFQQILDDDVPGQQRRQQQQSQAHVPSPPNGITPTPESPPATPPPAYVTPTVAAPAASTGSPGRCKYCFAELPSVNTGKCPGCGAALLSI